MIDMLLEILKFADNRLISMINLSSTNIKMYNLLKDHISNHVISIVNDEPIFEYYDILSMVYKYVKPVDYEKILHNIDFRGTTIHDNKAWYYIRGLIEFENDLNILPDNLVFGRYFNHLISTNPRLWIEKTLTYNNLETFNICIGYLFSDMFLFSHNVYGNDIFNNILNHIPLCQLNFEPCKNDPLHRCSRKLNDRLYRNISYVEESLHKKEISTISLDVSGLGKVDIISVKRGGVLGTDIDQVYVYGLGLDQIKYAKYSNKVEVNNGYIFTSSLSSNENGHIFLEDVTPYKVLYFQDEKIKCKYVEIDEYNKLKERFDSTFNMGKR